MKKVILQAKISEVYLDDLVTGDFIGTQTESGLKFMLSATKDGYEFISERNLTSSSKGSYGTFKSSVAYCENLFVFESAKELFKWMSE
jgi:hypothetical protein